MQGLSVTFSTFGFVVGTDYTISSSCTVTDTPANQGRGVFYKLVIMTTADGANKLCA